MAPRVMPPAPPSSPIATRSNNYRFLVIDGEEENAHHNEPVGKSSKGQGIKGDRKESEACGDEEWTHVGTPRPDQDSQEEDWTHVATTGSENEVTDDDDEIIAGLTYEAFWDFCKVEGQRADLWEELTDRSCHNIRALLRLFHATLLVTNTAGNLRQRAAYTEGTAQRLADSIQDLQPLAYKPGNPLQTALLSGFTRQAKVIESLAAHHRGDALYITTTADQQRRRIFDLMQNLGIEYSGASTFYKYGYLVRDRGEWEPKYPEDQGRISRRAILAPRPKHRSNPLDAKCSLQ